jgi:RHS repeat-associated protein
MPVLASIRVTNTFTTLPFACLLSAASAHPSISTGKERDAESGNDYFGARYYGSSMGRFMSPDFQDDETDPEPVPWANFENPQSLNLYSYVYNNPLAHADPDGHDCVNGSNAANGTISVQTTSDSSACLSGFTYVNGTVNPNSATYSNGQLGFNISNYADGSGIAGSVTMTVGNQADSDTLAAGVFGPASASTWTNASGAVNAAGGVEMTAIGLLMPELFSDAAIEGGLTGGAKLGEAAANRINHVFQAKHKLDALVQAFGGKQGAYEALVSATQKAVAGTAGPFEKVVQVGGQSVTVRGAVIDGAVKISTAFIR